jgi:hypothetical protein
LQEGNEFYETAVQGVPWICDQIPARLTHGADLPAADLRPSLARWAANDYGQRSRPYGQEHGKVFRPDIAQILVENAAVGMAEIDFVRP